MTASRTFIGLLAAFAVLAAFASTSGNRASASVGCSVYGTWEVTGSSNPGSISNIPCDQPKPGWVTSWTNPGHIEFVYDGDRVVAPTVNEVTRDGTTTVTITGTALTEVQETGATRAPVNQPVAEGDVVITHTIDVAGEDEIVTRTLAAFTYIADADNRAVRGTDGNCYREQRVNGQWQRSVSYGGTGIHDSVATAAEACRRASWNAHKRSQGEPVVDQAEGPFPSGAAPVAPVLQSPSAATTTAPTGNTVTVTFSENLDLRLAPPSAFHVTVNGARRNVATDGVAVFGSTVTLTLTSAVNSNDAVVVNYIKPPVTGTMGTSLTGKPTATTLTVTFSEDLDAGSVPAPSAFRVTVNGAPRTIATDGVKVSGNTVTLTLTSAVFMSDTVKVRYIKPSANPLRSPFGKDVAAFADQPVATDDALSRDGLPQPETIWESIWEARLTAGTVSAMFRYGCWDTFSSTVKCSGSGGRLSNPTFTVTTDGTTTTYRIVALFHTSAGELSLALDKQIPLNADLTLRVRGVDGHQFRLSEEGGLFLSKVPVDGAYFVTWTNTNLESFEGRTISFLLTVPPDDAE